METKKPPEGEQMKSKPKKIFEKRVKNRDFTSLLNHLNIPSMFMGNLGYGRGFNSKYAQEGDFLRFILNLPYSTDNKLLLANSASNKVSKM